MKGTARKRLMSQCASVAFFYVWIWPGDWERLRYSWYVYAKTDRQSCSRDVKV